MPTAILPSTVAVPRPPSTPSRTLSSVRFLSGAHEFPLLHPLSVDFCARGRSARELVIRMGGGPRTYPGGVSKWQWKRMQAKKSKQLLKARLCRERQLYEMRKRSELRAAASELERPWEVVERAPNLFSVAADEQLKVLADRFQRSGGFDMWNDRDGPQVFRSPVDGLPSARFFPKGVVHSVKPYGLARGPGQDSGEDGEEDSEQPRFDDWIARGAGGTRRSRRRRSRRSSNSGDNRGSEEEDINFKPKNLDEGTERGDQNLIFISENSRSPRNSFRQESGTGEDRRVSAQRGVAIDSRGETVAADNRLTVRSRNHGNSQRQRFRRGQYRWNEFDETIDDFKNLKVEGGEANSARPNASPRNHSRSQGFGACFRENVVQGIDAGNVERSKMGSNGRHSNGNSRSKSERVTLRPTTELFSREGSHSRKYPMQNRDNGFGRKVEESR
ncbi:unnamed protein product [Musa acuminata subsp. malaccensis]|uniref:(wild Malaysian banana) hypothetical protein n=1 Tax=Musa acuminata subsp. malaccensis TaxID=214687 RepID=A0A804J5Y3_MUSAM|nr:PREDICTED: uncharacterized protein LOC103985194 [Musa acuminata subsp. malaccensis]CAG1838903.1 unnamed protein product [Musa acuminata subsp. malaccensis]